jgi:hypothetical protein
MSVFRLVRGNTLILNSFSVDFRSRYIGRKTRKKRKEQQEEIRIRREIKEREAVAACEADRESKRERARRAKEAGPDAMRKGKYPR